MQFICFLDNLTIVVMIECLPFLNFIILGLIFRSMSGLAILQ